MVSSVIFAHCTVPTFMLYWPCATSGGNLSDILSVLLLVFLWERHGRNWNLHRGLLLDYMKAGCSSRKCLPARVVPLVDIAAAL